MRNRFFVFGEKHLQREKKLISGKNAAERRDYEFMEFSSGDIFSAVINQNFIWNFYSLYSEPPHLNVYAAHSRWNFHPGRR